MSLEGWDVFPDGHAGLLEDAGAATVHTVLELIDDFHDARLHDLDGAPEAWTCVAVEYRALCAAAVSAQLEQGIFLGMEAQALVEAAAARRALVAACASALVAVEQAAGCAVVAGGQHAVLPHNHGADAALHAVGAHGRECAQAHKVRVPCGAQSVQRRQGECVQVGMEIVDLREGIGDAQVAALEEAGEGVAGGWERRRHGRPAVAHKRQVGDVGRHARVWVVRLGRHAVQDGIVVRDERLERHGLLSAGVRAHARTMPPLHERRLDADQQEERPLLKQVDQGRRVEIEGDKPGAPVRRDMVQHGVRRGKVRRTVFAAQCDALESMLRFEVLGYGRLARTRQADNGHQHGKGSPDRKVERESMYAASTGPRRVR